MKVEFKEYEGHFGMQLSPESIEEAAALVRYGLNKTTHILWAGTAVYEAGTISTIINLGKRKACTSYVDNSK